jgi:PAS domain S-box-containing protein
LLEAQPALKSETGASAPDIRTRQFSVWWVVMFAVLGSLLSISSAWMMSERDKRNVMLRLETTVEARSSLLHHGIQLRLSALKPLASAFAVDASLDPQAFQAFLLKALPRIHGLRQVNWLPRISDLNETADHQAPGADYWTNPQMRTLTARARDSGQPVVSAPDIFDLRNEDRPEILVIQPIYSDWETPVSVTDRRRKLIGFVTGRIDVQEMIETSLFDLSAPAGLDMYFFDTGTQGAAELLHVHQSRLRQEQLTPIPTAQLRDGTYWEININLGSRNWSVVFRRSQSGLPILETQTAWAILIGGLVITFLITCIMLSTKRRNRKIGELVGEISQTNVNLKSEIEERVETEKKFRKLIEAAPDATLVCDRYGGIVHINAQAEELFGYSKIELLGQKIEILMPERFRGGHHLHRAGFYQNSQTRPMGANLELRAVTKSGREFPAEIGLGPIGSGDDWLVSTSIRDMTQRNIYEDELNRAREQAETQASDLEELNVTLTVARDQAEAAVRAKSEFLTLMSHELRTPLNAVLGFSQILRAESFGPLGNPKYREYVDNIVSSGQHLLELIGNILDLTKFDSGSLLLDEEIVDVGDLVVQMVSILKERALSGGVNLTYDLGDNLLCLRGDPRKLKHILACLIANGIKFTETAGEVSVAVWCREDSGLVVQVRDTGIGMEPKDISKALAPFGQVDSAMTRQYEGSGLGLPLAKALVELHGGSLDLQSNPGVGTTVTIRFPARRIVPAAPEPAALAG